jgi:K+-sensing histidine kinase KdpD
MQISKFWCSAVPCLVASVALALLTLICYRLHFNLATASILYVIVVVLLARTGTFVSSVVASIIAALGLAYLAPPEFSFRVSNPFDDVSIVAS